MHPVDIPSRQRSGNCTTCDCTVCNQRPSEALQVDIVDGLS